MFDVASIIVLNGCCEETVSLIMHAYVKFLRRTSAEAVLLRRDTRVEVAVQNKTYIQGC